MDIQPDIELWPEGLCMIVLVTMNESSQIYLIPTFLDNQLNM